jgi:hypothetical protein
LRFGPGLSTIEDLYCQDDMTFTRLHAAVSGALVGALLTAVLVGRGATIRIAQANTAAAVAAAQAEAAQKSVAAAWMLATATQDSLKQARAIIGSLEQRYRAAVRAIPESVPLPPVCQPCVDRSAAQAAALARADSVIAAKEDALGFASDRITTLTTSLFDADTALGNARVALTRQSERTEGSRPAKLLGLVPLPTANVGYGATLAAGKIHHGPTASVGWSIKF